MQGTSRRGRVHNSTVRCAALAAQPHPRRQCSERVPRLLNSRELPAVPIAKYFVVVGSALAALLLIAGWCLPEPPPSFPDRPEIIDGSAIRIRSEHKWPEKVVLDTSQPTLTPPVVADPPAQSPVPLPSDEARGQANLEAMAQLKPDPQPASIDRPTQQIKRGVARTIRSRRVARVSIRHRLARAETGRGCCQFDIGQASSNAMPFRRAASSWPFE
jgi:hypothetical protein